MLLRDKIMKKIKIGNMGKKDTQLLTMTRAKDRAIDGTISMLMNQKAQCEYQERILFYKHSTKEDREKYDSFSWDENGDLYGCEKEIADDYQEAFVKELVDSFSKKICEPEQKKIARKPLP
jgi:hypothetical protein